MRTENKSIEENKWGVTKGAVLCSVWIRAQVPIRQVPLLVAGEAGSRLAPQSELATVTKWVQKAM